MQDGSKGASHSSRDGANHFQPVSQATNRPREGYSVEDGVRRSSRSRPGNGLENRPGSKPGQGPDRRREEVPAGTDRPRSSDTDSIENSHVEVRWDSSGESTEASAAVNSRAGSGDNSGAGAGDSTSGSSGGSFSDSSYGSYEDGSEECVWCSVDCSGELEQPRVCPEHELLHSIAIEELAIAHLINAEAEKAQAVANQRLPPLTPDELIEFQHSIAKVLEMAVEKEKLLLKKLRLLLFKSSRREESDCET